MLSGFGLGTYFSKASSGIQAIPAFVNKGVSLDNDDIVNNATNGNLLQGINLGTGVTHVVNTTPVNGVLTITTTT